MTENRTAVIANMCDDCENTGLLNDGISVCTLYNNTLELQCVKENQLCPDYK